MRDHPSADTSAANSRKYFIPILGADLQRWLLQRSELSQTDREHLCKFCELLLTTLHIDFYQQLQKLKAVYAPYNPDSDKCDLPQLPTVPCGTDPIFNDFSHVMSKANFRQLSDEHLKQAVTTMSDWGVRLHVDFSIFQRVAVFVRGDVMNHRQRRRWQHFFRQEDVEVPTFQRLAIIFQLKETLTETEQSNSPPVYIKLFKNFPKTHLDMILPGTTIRMSLLDQGKIWIPTLSGLGITLFKLFPLLLAITQGIAAIASGIFTLIGLVVATIGYALKSVFGYMRTKDKYHLNLTRSLYYQNLDNNAGVLFRLLDEAEEQEFREALLAYFVLWKHFPDCLASAKQLDQAVELLVTNAISMPIDFEVRDALNKLERLNLVEHQQNTGWKAIPIDHALAELAHTRKRLLSSLDGNLGTLTTHPAPPSTNTDENAPVSHR